MNMLKLGFTPLVYKFGLTQIELFGRTNSFRDKNTLTSTNACKSV